MFCDEALHSVASEVMTEDHQHSSRKNSLVVELSRYNVGNVVPDLMVLCLRCLARISNCIFL